MLDAQRVQGEVRQQSRKIAGVERAQRDVARPYDIRRLFEAAGDHIDARIEHPDIADAAQIFKLVIARPQDRRVKRLEQRIPAP